MQSTNGLNFDILFIMEFNIWLEEELKKRHWNHAELARQINMTEPAISHVFSGYRKPGTDMCRAIARAFGLPPEIVFRQAGLLPNTEADSPMYEELKYWFEQMTNEEQELFLAQGRAILDVRKNRPKGKRRQQLDPETNRAAYVVSGDESDRTGELAR